MTDPTPDAVTDPTAAAGLRATDNGADADLGWASDVVSILRAVKFQDGSGRDRVGLDADDLGGDERSAWLARSGTWRVSDVVALLVADRAVLARRVTQLQGQVETLMTERS